MTNSYGALSNHSSSSSTTTGTVNSTFKQHQRHDSIRISDVHTPSTSFWKDLTSHGSVPHSVTVALSIGTICGISAWLYYAFLEWALDLLWKRLPEHFMGDDATTSSSSWMWVPLMGSLMALGLGLAVTFLGEPGDLPSTIGCVHSKKAYVDIDHVIPMVVASQCSILGGGSLGPEAPLVAICASVGGYISRTVFQCTEPNVIRKHTLMGMAGALAAFFGCPLGGSIFALEVNSRFGIEYFEHTVEAILCGEVCLAVFRALARLPIAPIWSLNEGLKLTDAAPLHIAYGVGIGLVGATVAAGFAGMHKRVLQGFRSAGLLESHRQAIPRAMVGAVVILSLGVMVPATLFWGEYEFQTIATLGPAKDLMHVWPTQGAFGFEMDSFLTALIVGGAKLVAISFTVAGGYRGGFIFPLFASGAALGRALYFVFPFIPVQLCVLCMAAALNVAITRTSIATTLILAYLSGEQNAVSAILAASLTSICATAYMPFMPTQVSRSDLEASLFRYETDDEDDTASGGTHECTPLAPQEHKVGTSVDV